MARRTIKNKTGFGNKEGVNHKDAWVCFPCLLCGETVQIRIGQDLLTPESAFEDAIWICPKCGYEHSCISDLPLSLSNFPEEWHSCEDPHCQSFWRAFFRMATKDVFSYWINYLIINYLQNKDLHLSGINLCRYEVLRIYFICLLQNGLRWG